MAVIKINKTKTYTVMSNYHFKEKEMSLKAKGLLSLMLSLPPNWDYSIAGLVAICKENKTSIESALAELKKFGYLEVVKKMPNETNSGRIEYEYIVYENKKQEGEKQGVENLPLEILEVENHTQLNTNKLNTNNNIYIMGVFDFWNSKNIICHKELNDDTRKAIDKALKGNSVDEIKTCIERYSEVIKNDDYFFKTKWTLKEFLTQRNAMGSFKDDGSKWLSFCEWKKNGKATRQNFSGRDYTGKNLNDLFDNLNEIEL